MFHRLFWGLFVVPTLLNAQTGPKPLQDKSAGDIFKVSGPSVVLIETYGEDGKVSGSGSGFLVSADGQIVTNFHVIAHSKQASVTLSNGDAYDSVGVLDVDKRKDIALLKIKAVSLPYLRLGHSGSAQVGDKLYTLGNPLGVFQNTLSDGILSGIRQMEGYKIFQLSAPISHGSSGSPVFNLQGEVIGIVEATLPEGQNLNFAIPIDYAAGMLDSRTVQPLSAYYEPEEKQEAAQSPAKEQTSVSSPSEAIKKDAFSYLGGKVGVWTEVDAELELGKPVDRRDAIMNNAVIGDIYKYSSPVPNLSAIELNMTRATKKLSAVYFYYTGIVPWKSVETTLGKNYKKMKLVNGRPGYLYQFQNRQLMVIVDSANNVYNVGIW
jgi:trypsin-like peptidase